jgi:hypothetical protein
MHAPEGNPREFYKMSRNRSFHRAWCCSFGVLASIVTLIVLTTFVWQSPRARADDFGQVATLDANAATVDVDFGFGPVRIFVGGTTPLFPGSYIKLGSDGKAVAHYDQISDCFFRDGVGIGVATPAEQNLFAIVDPGNGVDQWCHMLAGDYWIRTPQAALMPHGTTIGIALTSNGTMATVLEGSATFASAGGQVEMRAGDSYLVQDGQSGPPRRTQHQVLTDTEVQQVLSINGVISRNLDPHTRSMSFSGTVNVNQSAPPAGSVLEALVGGVVCGTATPSNSTFTIDVESAVTRRNCGVDGSTVSFQLRTSNGLIGLQPTATVATGNGVIPLQPTGTFTMGGSARLNLTGQQQSPDSCPTLTSATLSATTDSGSNAVTVSWDTAGGCPPFTGTISATYRGATTPYVVYRATKPSGIVIDTPPARCEGTFTVDYTLTITDSLGQRLVASASASVQWIC